jgi:Family of unknown function (DUF5362)
MEQNQDSSLFGLSMDATAKAHIAETARWARFLAIVGMIMCGLMAIGGILAMAAFNSTVNEYQGYRYRNSDMAGLGASVMIMYLVVAVIYFFPCMFTLRFANHTQAALRANDQNSLNEGLKNLKVTFRYMGILTIIGLAFFVLALLLGGLGALMSGM